MLSSFTFLWGEDNNNNNNNNNNNPIGLIVWLKYPKALANEASSTKLKNPRRLFRARENIKRASQSELKLKTREMFKARKNANGQDSTCSSFEFNWLRRRHDFFWTNCTAMWSKTEEVLNYLRYPEKKKLLVMTNYWCDKKRNFLFHRLSPSFLLSSIGCCQGMEFLLLTKSFYGRLMELFPCK